MDRFFAGPENALVEVAVRSILDDRTGRFNPLLLCGPEGTGKSHLTCGLAAQWQRLFRSRVICVTAKEFARELADAFEVNSVVEFRGRYRECSLLALEGIESLNGRAAAQIELVHTLDTLLARGSQIILTASEPPARMKQLHPTLASRLSAGLVVALAPPGVEVRMVVLRHLAEMRHVTLPEPVDRMLAEGIVGTVPDLCEAIADLEPAARFDGRTIDAESAREYIRRRSAAQEPPLSAIARHTARYFSLRVADLRGRSRRRAVVTARDIAMYLARRLTSHSLDQIGEYFGGRDHTTVSHGCRKTGSLLESDSGVQLAVQRLGSKWRIVN
ncbi:MAG: DnaA/Hda family protein [Thermoguttaceae bacterium]|jgi:chromosomal replication initiator protein|nr:DnaA/Hda family protein [Thermoguttaceae bacterium]